MKTLERRLLKFFVKEFTKGILLDLGRRFMHNAIENMQKQIKANAENKDFKNEESKV